MMSFRPRSMRPGFIVHHSAVISRSMPSLMQIAMVAIGGGVGASCRYVLGAWISIRAGTAFPWATLGINATGSFLLCFLAVAAGQRLRVSPLLYLTLGTGFCGGYTTFSTFSYETLLLASEGHWARAAANIAASVAAGLLFGALGFLAGRAV